MCKLINIIKISIKNICYYINIVGDYMVYLLILAIIPSIVIGLYIYKTDKVEKEPKGLLFKLFLLGIVSTIITLIVSCLLELINIGSVPVGKNSLEWLIYSFVFVALIEESSKWIFSYKFPWRKKDFNYRYDAIVYAVFVSLGFATVENIFYALDFDLMVIVTRGILTIPGHAFFAIFMGYYIGLAKQEEGIGNKKQERIYLLYSLLIPICLHGFFDYCLFMDNSISILIFFIFVISLYIVCFNRIRTTSTLKKKITIFKQKEVICSKCGSKVKTRYCTHCGTRSKIKW